MKWLDLFSKAGGAAMGLHRAGIEVVGVDIDPQPRYPFAFIQADVLTVDLDGYDGYWASPPCQRYAPGSKRWGTSEDHPHLIPAVRERLIATGKPYIIENVAAARKHLRHPIMLCGTMFDLGVFRHRLFETSFMVLQPGHAAHAGRVGDGRFHTVTGHAGGSSNRDGWKGGSTADWKIAMGIDWMNGNELAEAIPPVYAQFLAEQFLGGNA